MGGKQKWMVGIHDDSLGIVTLPSCVATGDLYGDGDTKLIVAHIGARVNMKLKVFKGVTLVAESVLAEVPVAIASFINEQTSLPSVAVASGPSLLIYKSLRPFYKYTVPSSAVNKIETEAWEKAGQQELSYEDLYLVISNLAKDISPKSLTPVSQSLLVMDEENRSDFIEKHSQKTITNPSSITCLTTMKKSHAENIDVLICGTEASNVHMVDSQAFNPMVSVHLPSIPTNIITTGVYDVDFRLFVSTRNGQIFTFKKESTTPKAIITCKTHIVSFAKINKMLAVATSNCQLSFYTFKGKHLNTITTPEAIKDVKTFVYNPKQFTGILVMLQNQIRLYSDRHLLDVIKSEKPLQWIRFGQFGREEAVLIIGTKDGGISVKLFRRTASLDEKVKENTLPAQSIKLNIPKKTRVFIDQTLREKEHAVEINHLYQKDLLLLRHHTCESYMKMVCTSLSSVSSDSNEPVELAVDVNGFGPDFRMTIQLTTSSSNPLYDMWLVISGNNKSAFSIKSPMIPVAVLTSSHEYTFTTLIKCLQPEKPVQQELRVLLVRQGKPTPLVSALVIMPLSEVSMLD